MCNLSTFLTILFYLYILCSVDGRCRYLWLSQTGTVTLVARSPLGTPRCTAHNAEQSSSVQCTEVQCSAVQCSAVQCSAVHCTALYCTSLQTALQQTILRDGGLAQDRTTPKLPTCKTLIIESWVITTIFRGMLLYNQICNEVMLFNLLITWLVLGILCIY